MSKIQGHIRKMRVANDDPVDYQLVLDEEPVAMNALLGETIRLTWDGVIHCTFCGRKTAKSYSQGFCFPCSQKLARCDMCIVRPHTCHFDKGTCREPDWGLQHCFQDHFVYLANSSGLKVGITRQDQLPTRWIDQGATQALPIFRTRSRHVAGMLEKAIGSHVSDRTDWRRMLKSDAEPRDLASEAARLIALSAADIEAVEHQFADRFDDAPFERADGEQTEISYPVQDWPDKIRPLNLDKTPEIESTLQGIKGQYLMLADGVLNVRKYTGYEWQLEY